jgi:tetratricopeptide (TPR) repeat protein
VITSTTRAENGPLTTVDEGLSWVVYGDFETPQRILLKQLVEEAGPDLLGDALWNAYHAWPVFAKFFDINLGDDLLNLDDIQGAIQAYEKAIAIGLPPHMFWYRFGPFDAYMAAKQYDKVLSLSDGAMTEFQGVEELHEYRAEAYEALGQGDKAIEEYQLVLQYHTGYPQAVQALQRLGVPLPATPTITPTKAK